MAVRPWAARMHNILHSADKVFVDVAIRPSGIQEISFAGPMPEPMKFAGTAPKHLAIALALESELLVVNEEAINALPDAISDATR